MAVTPEACRAGRAILKWSMRDLAERSGVAWTTINRLEGGVSARDATAAKIVAAFEAYGVELLDSVDSTGATLDRAHGSAGGPEA
tara:strand:+ start:203 stop:457 length:255 start_codon:yes stop_codon:yes gene_type:complete